MEFKFTIPIIGKIIAYIYDFCTYKRKYNLIVMFSQIEKYNNDYYFSIIINNNTDFNIEINNITVKNGILLRRQFIRGNEFEYINMHFYKNQVFLPPKNKKSQEISMTLKYTGQKTYIFVEYIIKDIKSNIFISDKRVFKKMIPL
jgi:hypothetical protein